MHKLTAIVASAFFLCASSAFADEDPQVVTAVVRSYESDQKLVELTCGLTAIADVGGHARLFDVLVGGKRCSSLTPQGDAIPLRVQIQHRADGWDDVVFEADVVEGTSNSEMREAVDAVARELFEKLGGSQQRTAPAMQESTEHKSSEPARGTRGGAIALMSIGGAGMGIAAMIGIVALIEAGAHGLGCGISTSLGGSCGSQDLSGMGIAAGVAGGLGLVMLATGGILLSYAPPKSAVSAHLGPTGGSVRVTF